MSAAAPEASGYGRVTPAHDQHSTPKYLAVRPGGGLVDQD